MANKRGSTGGQSEGNVPRDEDLPSVTPRELYPVSDIRFVIHAIGKLESKVDRLIEDTGKHGDAIAALDKTLHGFKTAVYIGGPIIAVAALIFWFLEGDRITAILKQPTPITQVAPAPTP